MAQLRKLMLPDRRGPIPEKALQDYLRALEENADVTPEERQEKLLQAYAELQYSLRGGGRCSACGAHVRHALPVTVERAGKPKHYDCLCLRCLAAEKAAAGEVTLRVGKAAFHYSAAKGRTDGAAKVKRFRDLAPLQSS